MNIERNSSIVDDFPKMSEHIVRQLMLQFKTGGDAWKDGHYTKPPRIDAWPIMQGEALRTILMLCRSFSGTKAMILKDKEYTAIVRDTLTRLLKKADENDWDTAPYKDFDPVRARYGKFVFIESLYTAGSAFFYALAVFGDDKRIVADKIEVETALASITNKLRKNYLFNRDDKTAAWGFCDLGFKDNFHEDDRKHHYELLYFTYNTINFITLLQSASSEDLNMPEAVLKEITDQFFNDIRRWLEKDFLTNRTINMLEEAVDIRRLDDNFNDVDQYRIYNNLYVVNSLLLLGSSEQDALAKAVINACKYVIDRFRTDFSFDERNYPEYKFPLSGLPYDEALRKADKGLLDALSYDDRSAHALVLMSLALLAQQQLDRSGSAEDVDPEVISLTVTAYEELLKIRATRTEYLYLWDSINNPSIYYTLRAVDAITEFYSLAKRYGDIPVVSAAPATESPAVVQADIREVVRQELHGVLTAWLKALTPSETPPVDAASDSELEQLVNTIVTERLDEHIVDNDRDLGQAVDDLRLLEKAVNELKGQLEEVKRDSNKEDLNEKLARPAGPRKTRK